MNDLYRLNPSVYEKLEQQLPKPVVTKDTSEHQTGYLLGIQYVLLVLRQGFTIDADRPAGEQTFRTRAR
jgi:hypothetical protein